MGVKLDREGFENRTRSRRAFDAIRVKVRDEGTVRNKAVYVALGVRPEGANEILGLWIEQTEGAKSAARQGRRVHFIV